MLGFGGHKHIIWLVSCQNTAMLENFDGFLFDMDGTLTQNAHFHDLVWEKVMLERYGYRLEVGDPRVHGGKTKFITESLLGRSKLEMPKNAG
jgi:beta-phosphoglucomutase-like phosphatase (HAD superfamily)